MKAASDGDARDPLDFVEGPVRQIRPGVSIMNENMRSAFGSACMYSKAMIYTTIKLAYPLHRS